MPSVVEGKKVGLGNWAGYSDCTGNALNLDIRCNELSIKRNGLKEYVTEAKRHLEAMGGGNTVFVMTDDPKYIREEIPKFPDMSIFMLAAHGQPGDLFQNAGHSAFDETVDTITSVKLASARCRSYAGDFSSGFAQYVYRYMCYWAGDCPEGKNMEVHTHAKCWPFCTKEQAAENMKQDGLVGR
jgi:hypothetical protein